VRGSGGRRGRGRGGRQPRTISTRVVSFVVFILVGRFHTSLLLLRRRRMLLSRRMLMLMLLLLER